MPDRRVKAMYDESFGLFNELYLSLVDLYRSSAKRQREALK